MLIIQLFCDCKRKYKCWKYSADVIFRVKTIADNSHYEILSINTNIDNRVTVWS